MKRIVFSDVDGTLLNSEHKITPLTRQAMEALRRRDIPFVIVSARSPSGIYPILEEYGFNCPIISYSGALILDENRSVLFQRGMDRSGAEKIIAFIEARRFDLTWCVYSFDEWIVKKKDDARVMREEAIVKAQAREGSIRSLTAPQVHKILLICNPEQTSQIESALREAFPEYSIARSSDILLEVMARGITKAAAVQTLCSLWDAPVSEAVAFGDQYNDVEMLETVAYGFLMGNAPAELKKRIERLTEDNDHDGIYHALLRMDLI